MKNLKFYLFLTLIALQLGFSNSMNAQNNSDKNQVLDMRQKHIVIISSFTAKGDLQHLTTALNDALNSGLTINEIKEVLVHLYAYCGFPRSLQGINTLIAVLETRRAKGITDKPGKEATKVEDGLSKYERGKKVLETLTGQREKEPKTGYAALSPEIEVFLKEHLFADIFSRDILSYSDREIATISALTNLGGVEPMMQSHMRIALNIGLSESQLMQMLAIIDAKVGREEADAGRKVLSLVSGAGNLEKSSDINDSNNILYAQGIKAPAERFTGTVWVNMLVQAEDQLDCSIGVVTFEPGARTNWHLHPGGQALLVTEGKGYFQERGKSIKIMQKGDVIKCPPGVEHWHGASTDIKVTHIAITTNSEKGPVAWLQKVTDKEYNSFK
jgi:4-carboxymuconolactone decarboxylase